MRYTLPSNSCPIQGSLTSTDPKFMPDADPDLQVSSSAAGQDAANGNNTPPRGGMTLHERGSNTSPGHDAKVIFDK